MAHFLLQKDYEGRELKALIYAINNSDEHTYELTPLAIPKLNDDKVISVGTVEWVEGRIGSRKPKYYPNWTRDYWFRNISLLSADSFVKPANNYKAFNGVKLSDLLSGYSGELIRSDVVNFTDEWRYYVSNGEVLTSWWYQGSDKTSETDPNGPKLEMNLPHDFCGAIDMGYLDSGEFALVEVHHPYAIGWYGDMSDCDNYLEFIKNGWNYLLSGGSIHKLPTTKTVR